MIRRVLDAVRNWASLFHVRTVPWRNQSKNQDRTRPSAIRMGQEGQNLDIFGGSESVRTGQAPGQSLFVTTQKTDTAGQTTTVPTADSGLIINWDGGASSTGLYSRVSSPRPS